MSDTVSEAGSTGHWDFDLRIDEVCDRFEAAWKSGQRPRIEDYVEDSPAPACAALLRELVPLDIEYRKRQGETPSTEEYLSRFPYLSPEEFAERPGSTMPARAGRYRLQGEIAHGGMGAVFRALDPDFNRSLAVKVLLEQHRGRADLETRFLEEAQILGQLQHPGIVPVHEIGRLDDGRPFFAMKLIQGDTLEKLLQERPSPDHDLPRFLAIFEQICQTMANAHAHGVIHRDLKPSNVMVGAFGEVQVMDWGLAKVLQKDSVADDETSRERQRPEASVIRTERADQPERETQPGTVIGTWAYMPPNQAQGMLDTLDERCDVFSLGSILCILLTGEPAYRGTGKDLRRQAEHGDITDVFARLDVCTADPELIALAKRCLAVKAEDRPRNAGVLATEITAYLKSVAERLRQAELASAKAQAKAIEERKRRKLALALASSVLAMVVVGAAGGFWVQHLQNQRREDIARQQLQQRQAVEAALEKVAGLLKEARWKEAEAVLVQAREHLGESGPTDLLDRVEQSQINLALVTRLDAVRQKRSTLVLGEFDNRTAYQDYTAAFKDMGVGEEGEEAETVATRVRQSAVCEQLVAALDDWALVARDRKRRAWLLQVARRADSDPWRDRFRDLQVWDDPAALEALAGELLRDEAQLGKQKPQLLAALGTALAWAKADPMPLLAAAQAGHPEDFWLNFNLGNAFAGVKQWDQAVGYYRAALAMRPNSAAAHNNLGGSLHANKQLDAAIQEFRTGIKFDPNVALIHFNLGYAQRDKKELDKSIHEYRTAINLDPNYALAHVNLGVALHDKKERDAAIQEYRTAIKLDPTCALAHTNLGIELGHKKQLDEAIVEFRTAINLDPKDAQAHKNLGTCLAQKNQLDEAILEFRKAIHFDPKDGQAHYNLAIALRLKGQLGESRDVTVRCLELLSRDDPLYPLAAWQLQLCEQLLARLGRKISAVLEGKDEPADDNERLGLARLCQESIKKLYAASARFYADAFDHDPKLADNMQHQHRYNAACAAALAGCRQGNDAGKLDDKDLVRLRNQSLAWLRADLDAWTKLADQGKADARAAAVQALQHWQTDSDLAGVRDKEALANLPESEQDAWRKFWADVEDLLKSVAEKK